MPKICQQKWSPLLLHLCGNIFSSPNKAQACQFSCICGLASVKHELVVSCRHSLEYFCCFPVLSKYIKSSCEINSYICTLFLSENIKVTQVCLASFRDGDSGNLLIAFSSISYYMKVAML